MPEVAQLLELLQHPVHDLPGGQKIRSPGPARHIHDGGFALGQNVVQTVRGIHGGLPDLIRRLDQPPQLVFVLDRFNVGLDPGAGHRPVHQGNDVIQSACRLQLPFSCSRSTTLLRSSARPEASRSCIAAYSV